ncbi:MAG: alpha/beta fold hydrolase [Proteobacteria bacterium]|nr:alpha/beta fold hydrolase [Pseudomonadota bacterium]
MNNLVLLHGFGYGPGIFSSFVPALPASWKVHCPEWTKMIHEGLDGLLSDLPSSFDLCGWSQGGQLAARLACHAPDRVRRIAFLAANMKFVSSDEWSCAMPSPLFESFAASLKKSPTQTMKKFSALATMGSMKRIRLPFTAQLDPLTLNHQMSWLRNWDMRELAMSIEQPSCCLHGSSDFIVPAEAGQRLAALLRDGRYIEVRNAGHALFLSHADYLSSYLRGFFQDEADD